MLKAAARLLVRSFQRSVRRREIERTAPHVDRPMLVQGLRDLGIEQGDVILLHSSLKSLGYVEGGPDTVLAALLEAIGSEGTLILPTYYQPGGTIYATCKIPDYVFDPAIHGTGLGALPSAFLKHAGVERSLHPTHSVSAVGPMARFITETHHLAPSIFGVGSPWERFLHLDGKVLGLGISMGPVTFYHLLEDLTGDEFPLPVRMKEVHQLRCRSADGQIVRVPVVPLDPDYMRRRIDNPVRKDLQEYFRCEFESAGLLRVGKIGEGSSWVIGARDFYTHLRRLMIDGITIYATAEELARRPVRRP
jgi:aminoglycoside 3-N-acetyltransferase